MSEYCSIIGILLKHFVSHVLATMFYYAQTLKFSNMESYPNHLLKIYQNHAQPYLRYQYQIDPRGP
jgi:hypothetical protein